MLRPNPNKSINSFVFDCPVCNAKHTTFDVKGWGSPLKAANGEKFFQLFSICRACKMAVCIDATIKEEFGTPFLFNSNNQDQNIIEIYQKLLTENEKDLSTIFSSFKFRPILPKNGVPPEYLPKQIEDIFVEASKCLSVGCFNACAAMFRLCLDVVTKELIERYVVLLPTREDKKSIHSRLNWIFKHNLLNKGLEELSRCIKDDGNDGAHDGSLTKDEAYDLLDFTYELLEQVYTQPERIRLANERRKQRRQSNG